MKLQEYLESFKNFDPELEVFIKHPDFWTVDKLHRNQAEIIYVGEVKSTDNEYTNSPDFFFNKKAILL